MRRAAMWVTLALTLSLVGCGSGEDAGMEEMEPEASGQMESGMEERAMEAGEMEGDSGMMEDEMEDGEMGDPIEEGMPEEMMDDTTSAMSGGV